MTYFGLRKYDGGEEVWDGDENCEHEWGANLPCHHPGQVEQTKWKDAQAAGYGQTKPAGNFCSKCGAWKGQLGAEPTPELYIQHLIQIMREVRRVLRHDGVFFINVGDSWSGSGGAHKPEHANPGLSKSSSRTGVPLGGLNYNGCKPLDMVLIPEQLALAARADGWYVRSILIWAKGVSLSDEFNGNPMPESVNGWRWERHKVKVSKSARAESGSYHSQAFGGTPMGARDGREFASHDKEWQDCPGCPKCEKNGGYVLRKGSWRPTDSYEQILMLTKTNSYFCDREAVLEKQARDYKVISWDERKALYGATGGCQDKGSKQQVGSGWSHDLGTNSGRNLRSVLLIPTTGYKGAHFAVYNPKLIEPLIKSATSEKGCCPKCGAPYARVIDKGEVPHDGSTECKNPDEQGSTRRLALMRQAARERGEEYSNKSSTVGWLPTCECGTQETEPCRVLDPFSGAGTTALVCERLGLDSISIDTSTEYISLAEARIAEDEQKRVDEQIRQLRKEAKLASKGG